MSKKPAVLYVDDESYNLRLLKILFMEEFEVEVADSGFKALEIIKSNIQIDAVISDMNMPKMNGIEFVEEARKHRNNIPYFILSGYDLNRTISQALKNGTVQHYLQKPFNKNEIIEIVNNAIT